MGRLTKIIQGLIKVLKENDLAVNDAVLFEQACSYHRGELANSRKDNKATDKQMSYLEKLGYKGTKDLSKEEANVLIDSLKNKSNQLKPKQENPAYDY